ncbi:two-partner secretion domain-containing protein [Coleofasciculus sp. E2-BRE-01]|uniref:two-partner secretion domain-containing protein n=1 Tax=Coleofasciculus sp. E2-BRE-01 TaxID=3069524 RepID=UPI0032FC18BD
MLFYQRIGIWTGLSAIACILGLTPGVVAQIVPDNSLGSEGSIVTPNVNSIKGVIDRIDGGAIRGSSLFHSFQDLNVDTLQKVYFANPAGIEAILGRVTGTQSSSIFGTLGVLGNANLYLINPNGILFGQDAQLDISGSFFAGTNESLLLDNGYQFSTENPDTPPLLTLNISPGLQTGLPAQGVIYNRGNLFVGQNLTFVGQSIDLEGQLNAGEDLTVQGTDSLKIRDTITHPFIAQAGNQLLIQGNKVDVFALNHSASGFFSGGDMVFRSANAIGGNAHFFSGGNFWIEQTNGNPGDLSSSDDPVIRASGDVNFGSYTGASLHIFAGGSVTADSITVNGTDTTANSIQETVVLSDGTTIDVDGSETPTVDIRAGTTAFNPQGNTGDTTGFTPALNTTGTGTSADITIDQIFNFGGLVFLTNQYQPNPNLSGDITVDSRIRTPLGPDGGGKVVIDSRGKITTPSTLDTSGFDLSTFTFANPGGDITLLANGDIFMPNGSQIFSEGSAGGSITLKSQSAIIQEEAPSEASFIESAGYGDGQGGDVILEAPSIFLSNFVQSNLRQDAAGTGGKLIITADSLTANNAILVNVTRGGDGGKVIVNADSIELKDSQIGSRSVSGMEGDAGDVEINTDTLIAEGATPSVLSITEATGDGGKVTINANSISLLRGTQIRTTTIGTGDAGDVEINADDIVVDGAILRSIPGVPEPIPSVTAIASEVSGFGASPGGGNGGQIEINTRRLSVTNGAGISASTGQGKTGDAGEIVINASESVVFDGNPGEPFSPSGAFVGTLSGATGEGGSLAINTPSLSVTNGAQLEALTEGSGNAGKIEIDANSIFISGEDTGLFSNAAEGSSGDGGLIQVTGNALILKDGAQISTDTAGTGDAGNTVINVDNVINIMGEDTGIFSSTTSESTGNSGSIFIDPELVQIRDGGAISVDSEGTGTGGSIQLQGGRLILDNGRISAEAASDDGGNIALSLDDIIILRGGSLISATAGIESGFGNGGNIQIATPFVVAIPGQNSDITANAFQGDGGNISIATNTLFFIELRDLTNPREVMTNDITVTSDLGVDGTFSLSSPEIDPESGLIKLPDQLADTSNQVVKTCAAAEGNVFTITGRGGVPSDPTAPIRGQTLLSDVRDFAATAIDNEPQAQESVPNPGESTSEGRYLVEATGWVKNEQGEVELVAAVPQETLPNQYANCHSAR